MVILNEWSAVKDRIKALHPLSRGWNEANMILCSFRRCQNSRGDPPRRLEETSVSHSIVTHRVRKTHQFDS